MTVEEAESLSWEKAFAMDDDDEAPLPPLGVGDAIRQAHRAYQPRIAETLKIQAAEIARLRAGWLLMLWRENGCGPSQVRACEASGKCGCQAEMEAWMQEAMA